MTNVAGNTGRITWIDEIKGLMLLIVLVEHVGLIPGYLNYVIVFLGAMAMPCYFALSGYLYSTKRDFREFFSRKCHSLLFPYLALSLLLLLLDHRLYMGEASSVIGQNLHKIFIECSSTEKGTPLWFVLTLFWMELLNYPLCKRGRHPEYMMLGLGVLFSIVAKMLYSADVRLLFNLNSFFTAYLFFALGYWLKNKAVVSRILERASRKTVWTASLVTLCFMGVLVVLTPDMGGVFRGKIVHYFTFYAFGIVSIFIAFILFRLRSRTSWLLLFVARNGMTILAFHAYIQLYTINVLRYLNFSDEAIFYLSILTSLTGTVALSFVINRYGWKLVGFQQKKTFKQTLHNL